MKKYQVELNINAVVYGNRIRHKATYVVEADIRDGWEDCAATIALIENWEDIIEQFDFVSIALDQTSRKSIIEAYASKVCFADASKVKVTII